MHGKGLGVEAGKFWGLQRIFARISPNLPVKFFVRLLPTNFRPQRSWRHFFDVTSENCPQMFFCKDWGPVFEVKQSWAPFLPGCSQIFMHWAQNFRDFAHIFQDFAQIFDKPYLFWSAPASPPPTTLGKGVQVFEQISKCVPIQKRLTTTGLTVINFLLLKEPLFFALLK